MSPRKQKTRRLKPRISNVAAAGVALVVILFACYMVFDGTLPFGSSPYILKAAFTSNTDLHLPSPVRIAGVDVGEVVHVDRLKGSDNAGIVEMQIDKSGLPIHANATVTIRSRTFLEGNFYVALSPGTPSSPILASGSTLPAANTSGPVQLDRVVSALDGNARAELQKLVQGLGSSLNGRSVAADEKGQPAAVKDMTGAQGLNYALKYSSKAFEAAAIVNQALLGERPHDLSGVVKGEAAVFEGLARSGKQLGTFVDGFEKTMAALASQQGALRETISLLPGVLRTANRADTSLSASYAPTQKFARSLTGSIKQLPQAINALDPWLKQATLLTSGDELGGLLKQLNPAVASTSVAVGGLKQLATQTGNLSACFNRVLIPDANEKITVDPSLSPNLKLYQELMQGFVGVAGASGDYDGNGRYVRATVGGGSTGIKTGQLPSGRMYGNAVLSPLGTYPAFPASGKAPAVDTKVPCYSQKPPDLNSSKRGGTP